MSEFEKHPDLPPPASEVGVVGWLRKNLFSNIPNSIMTLVRYLPVVPGDTAGH